MSQEYWVKLTAEGEQYGPYPGSEIKKFAAEGRVTPESLVSLDRATWHKAGRIKGLFATAPTPAAGRPATTPAPAPAPVPHEFDVAPRAAPQAAAPSLGYYTTPVGGEYRPLKRRSTIPFQIIAALMFLAGATVTYFAFTGAMSPTVTAREETLVMSLGATCGFLLISIPALILWLTWVHGVHKDLRQMSAGGYEISPAKAVGLSFIPFFDAYWVVYMPWRLSAEVNRHLAVRGLKPISSGTVMSCQIVSVVAALFLPAVTPVMYAVSMMQVQGGLNRLLAAPTT